MQQTNKKTNTSYVNNQLSGLSKWGLGMSHIHAIKKCQHLAIRPSKPPFRFFSYAGNPNIYTIKSFREAPPKNLHPLLGHWTNG